MARRPVKIIVFDAEGGADVFPNGKVEETASIRQILRDIKDAKGLEGDYEFYVRIEDVGQIFEDLPLPVKAIAVLPAKVARRRAVDLE